MNNQTIYIAYGYTKEKQPTTICWHTDKNIAEAFGMAMSQKFELELVGVFPCEPVPEAVGITLSMALHNSDNKPDPQDNITNLIVRKLQKLVDYVYGLHPDLESGEIAAITAFLIDGLPHVIESCDLKPNINEMAAKLKHKRYAASVADDN